MKNRLFAGACLSAALCTVSLDAQPARRQLGAAEVDAIAKLLMLEDTRLFDSSALVTMLRSTQPEIRRRSALAIGRIADPRGRALLHPARGDADTAVAATVVFATAQLYDTASVEWLDSLMSRTTTPVTVATEAARALGMIRTPQARAALARFLATASMEGRAPVVGEALLSIGRHVRGDLAPIERWTVSRDNEVRWRATWALFRPRNPASVAHLLRLTEDPFWHVRNWAVRGLVWNQVDTSGVEPTRVRDRLRVMATSDSDRTVRTEALRALATHPDSASVAFVATMLESADAWMSVSAAEGLGTHRPHAAISVPRLVAATNTSRPCALRTVALTAINTLNPEEGFQPAAQMARDTATQCRSAAVTFFRTKGERAREVLGLLRDDPATEVATAARNAFDALSDTSAGRGGRGGRGGGGGGGRAGRGRPIPTNRTEADYKQIVERWVVPEYRGAPRPRAEWATPRGSFVIELYPGDAPIATDDFVKNVSSGAIVNVPFSRLVPDFVAQQSRVAGAVTVRDEVSRHRLTRANVSWATGGLDTGAPAYTLGHTPQPHNEGGFTALGRIVSGMDVVDRIQLGDRIISTKMLPAAR